MKNLKYLIIALVFFVAGFLVGQSYQFKAEEEQQNQPAENQIQAEAQAEATLVFKFDENNIREIQNLKIEPGVSVLDFTRQVAEQNQLAFETKDYGELGLLVTKIGDQENNQQNKFWNFYVNGEFSNVGSGQTKLNGGEKVEWVFQESEY